MHRRQEYLTLLRSIESFLPIALSKNFAHFVQIKVGSDRRDFILSKKKDSESYMKESTRCYFFFQAFEILLNLEIQHGKKLFHAFWWLWILKVVDALCHNVIGFHTTFCNLLYTRQLVRETAY